MKRAAAVLASAALAIGLGSCGGSAKQSSTAPQRSPGAGVQPGGRGAPASPARPAPGLQGRLSQAEYRSIKRAYTLLRPLRAAGDIPRALSKARTACVAVAQPSTHLVDLVRADCEEALQFFRALNGIETALTACRGASLTAQDECVAERYSTFGVQLRVAITSGLLLNHELATRGIGGLCARSIGMSAGQLATFRKAASAAEDAASLLGASDPAGFLAAQKRLVAALGAGDDSDPLTGIIRGCRHAGAPAPRRNPPRERGGIKA